MKLSVIIPVYNNANMLERTLKSVCAQSYTDFEVLVINDGSTDQSQKIIDQFCKADSRFHSFFQENAGVSAARNLGLDHARGEYVTFVDGDDTIPVNAFRYMFQITVIHDADTVIGVYERVDGVTTYTNKRMSGLTNKTRRIQPDDLDLPHGWSLCNKWFLRSIIEENGLRMEKLMHIEDGVFLYRYLQHAKKIYSCPHIMYTYRKPLPFVGRTTTQKVDESLLDSAERAFARLLEITKGYGENFQREMIYKYIIATLGGDYYRRLWKLTDRCAEKLVNLINGYLECLDKERRERIIGKEFDILTDSGILTKKDIMENPLIIIGVGETYNQEILPIFLECLYDQSEPGFCVVLPEGMRKAVTENYRNMDNLFFTENPVFETVMKEKRSTYVAFLDETMLYDHQSLSTMARIMERDVTVDFVALQPKVQNGLDAKPDAVMEDSFANNHPEADSMLADKLFRRASLKGRVPDALEAYRTLSCQRKTKPAMVIPECRTIQQMNTDVSTDQERPSGNLFARFRAKHTEKIRRSEQIKAEKIAEQKGIEEIRQLISCEGKTPKSAKYFYLNEEVDPNLIVIEGLGKTPRGNMLYVLKELQKDVYNRFQIFFSVRKDTVDETRRIFALHGLSKRVNLVTAGTAKYRKALFSAGYLFNEAEFPNWWVKKPGQIYVNLWPGTPIKRLGKAKSGWIHHDANASRNFTMADYLLYPNEYTRKRLLEDCNVSRLTRAEAIMLGYPRTGVLFDQKVRERVRAAIGSGKGKKVLAYMPTWQDTLTSEYAMKFLEEMDQYLSEDQVLYVHLHHRTALDIHYDEFTRIHEFPKEFDTYEFLGAVDLLISDYSSVFFDFAVTGRKIVLYCPDRASYDMERGLYFQLSELPFPITETTEELLEAVNSPKEYNDQAFLAKFAPYDSKKNAERLCTGILLGDRTDVKIEPINPKVHPATMVVSDSLSAGRETDLLYRLKEMGELSNDVYLSFTEEGVDEHTDSAYPLVRDIPLYATKGKVLTERCERQRLYNDLALKRVILLDCSDPIRIRVFARFDEPVVLFVNSDFAAKLRDGDQDCLKAFRLFARWGSEICTLHKEDHEFLQKVSGKEIRIIRSAEEFRDRFLR